MCSRAQRGTSLDVRVGGVTAGYDDFADVSVGKLPLFVGGVVGLGCLLLLVAFRSLGVPLKAAAMNIAAVDAFVLRTLLVPALMHLLGAANWWLPRWLQRRLPHVGIEPPDCRAAHERLGRAPVHELRKEERHDVRDIAR